MGKAIDLVKYKEDKKNIKTRNTSLDALGDRISVDYKMFSCTREELIHKIVALENRHKFDLEFLKLVDLFMQKEFPEYSWKFDIFLKNIDGKNNL